jgi:hypothetical protein
MTLREVTSLEAAGEAAARVCMITVFPAGSDWIVKLDASAEPGEGLRRFASREQAVMFARSLAHAHRPSVVSVELREGTAGPRRPAQER